MDGIPALGPLLDLLQHSGPAGAVLSGVIVALTLSVIVLARLGNIGAAIGDRAQSVAFQQRLLKAIEISQATEEALRHRVDELGRDKAMQQDELDDLRVQLALLRHQRRRLIAMLRDVVVHLPEPAIRSRGARA